MESDPMPFRPLRRSIRRAASAALLALAAVSCAGDDATRPDGGRPPWLWWTIGRFEHLILSVAMKQDTLYVAAGTGGLYRDPSGAGAWEHLGLAFPELEGAFPLYGVNEIAGAGAAVVATVRAPEDAGLPRIYRLEPPAPIWSASDSGIVSGAVVSLLESGRSLVALDAGGGTYRSEDGGRTWRAMGAIRPIDLVVEHAGPAGLYLAGMDSGARPALVRSRDGGVAWEEIPLPADLSRSGEDRIASLAATVDGGDTLLYLGMQNGVRRRRGGEAFAPLLETRSPATAILVDPADPRRLVVAADRLYYSRDGGLAWKRFDTPHGYALGGAAADWAGGTIAAWEWQPWPLPLVLHSFSLELADAALEY